jgi:hypothetical protein
MGRIRRRRKTNRRNRFSSLEEEEIDKSGSLNCGMKPA